LGRGPKFSPIGKVFVGVEGFFDKGVVEEGVGLGRTVQG
jgi:hypothetical protein